MRILHVLSQTELTGSEIYAQNLVEDQARKGHRVWVASDRFHVRFSARCVSLPISKSSFFDRLANILALRRLIKTNEIEIVHCHSRGASRHAHAACWLTGTPMITTLHGRQHSSLSKKLFDSYGELIIAVCENLKASLTKEFGIHPSKIKTLRNPVDASLFTFQPDTLKKKLLVVTRSSGRKGEILKNLIFEAFGQWLSEFPELEIKIVCSQFDRLGAEGLRKFESLQMQFPDRLSRMENCPSIPNEMRDSQIVLGGGRVAVESILSGSDTFVIGENSYLGLATDSNMQAALNSNFGDIGVDVRELPINFKQIYTDVSALLKNGPSSNELKKSLRQRLEFEFSSELIQDNIITYYKNAQFKKRHSRWIPILMYHKIPDANIQSRHKIYVSKSQFEKHLRIFRWLGFTPLWFSDLYQFWIGEKDFDKFPRKPLLLTFDDGYVDNLTNASPLLEKYKTKANLFLLANPEITQNNWDQAEDGGPAVLMDKEQRRHLLRYPWEIGSHGQDHLRLTEVSEEVALAQMTSSKKSLEIEFQKPVFAFAYPFGSTNERLPELARKADYYFALNTDSGGMHMADDPQSLFRVNVFPDDGWLAIWKKTSPWYRRYFYLKRKH